MVYFPRPFSSFDRFRFTRFTVTTRGRTRTDPTVGQDQQEAILLATDESTVEKRCDRHRFRFGPPFSSDPATDRTLGSHLVPFEGHRTRSVHAEQARLFVIKVIRKRRVVLGGPCAVHAARIYIHTNARTHTLKPTGSSTFARAKHHARTHLSRGVYDFYFLLRADFNTVPPFFRQPEPNQVCLPPLRQP